MGKLKMDNIFKGHSGSEIGWTFCSSFRLFFFDNIFQVCFRLFLLISFIHYFGKVDGYTLNDTDSQLAQVA